jgi:hypothetical protein
MNSNDDSAGSLAGELDKTQALIPVTDLSQVKTEAQVTGPLAKVLRKNLKHSQSRFWSAIGITQSGGCRYELGEQPIPQPVRILIFARYIAGLEIDASTRKGAAELVRLAHLQAAARTQ